jgi:hypothetical protein
MDTFSGFIGIYLNNNFIIRFLILKFSTYINIVYFFYNHNKKASFFDDVYYSICGS